MIGRLMSREPCLTPPDKTPCIKKDHSQPQPFSKLLILHRKEKSYCFTLSCARESMFHYFWQFHSSILIYLTTHH